MSTKFTEETFLAVDTNVLNAVTAGVEIKENSFVSWAVLADTGAHAIHIITLQCSLNGLAGAVNWVNILSTIPGVGTEHNVQVTCKFIRFKVTTAEGEASTVNIIINAK